MRGNCGLVPAGDEDGPAGDVAGDLAEGAVVATCVTAQQDEMLTGGDLQLDGRSFLMGARRPGLHTVTELDQPVPDPGLERAKRNARHPGDLGIGVLAVEREQDGLPLQVAQPAQARVQELAVGGACRSAAARVRRPHGGGPQVACGGGRSRADPVDRAAAATVSTHAFALPLPRS